MKKYNLFRLLLLTPFLFFHCGPGEKPVALVTPTQMCTIVTDLGPYNDAMSANLAAETIIWDDISQPENQACIHAWAALELQTYLSKLLVLNPSDLPIVDDDIPTDGPVIFIGTPKDSEKWEPLYKKLKKRWKRSKSDLKNGFRLDTFYSEEEQNFLVLSGESPNATLYAVYEFLDRLGIRWISPDETGEIVPTQGGLVVQPLDHFIVPQIQFRGFLYDYLGPVPQNQRINNNFLQWMARNRLNLVQGNDSLQYLYKKLGIKSCNGDAYFNEMPLNPYAECTNSEATDLDGDGIISYLEAHPEWYQVNQQNQSPVLCVSQPKLINELTNQIKNRWPHFDYITIYNIQDIPWCNCQYCSNVGNNSNKLLFLLNSIYHKIHEHSKIQIIGLTDTQTMQPPSLPLPDNYNPDHTHLFFSPVKRCYNHAIDDPVCTDINNYFLTTLSDWTSRNSNFTGKINICEMYNNRSFQNLPVVFTKIMNQDCQAYHNIAVNGLCIQNPLVQQGGVQALMNYQLSRGSWRSAVDLDSLKIEYIVNQYPGAYQLMQEYYSKLEEAMANISAWKWELPDRANQLVIDSTITSLMPLGAFENHFILDENGSHPQMGSHWERTYQLVYEVQYILFDALTSDIPPLTKKRLLELNEYKKYSELVVNLYDNILRVLTLGQNEPEMRIEALVRLESVAVELQSFTIKQPAFGIANGLQASGIEHAVLKILHENRDTIEKYKIP